MPKKINRNYTKLFTQPKQRLLQIRNQIPAVFANYTFQFPLKYRSSGYNINYKVYKWFTNQNLRLQEDEIDEDELEYSSAPISQLP